MPVPRENKYTFLMESLLSNVRIQGTFNIQKILIFEPSLWEFEWEDQFLGIKQNPNCKIIYL